MLTIASDDPDEPAITVSLSGTGLPPPVITVTPASLSSTLYPGGVETQTLTIGNVGQSDLAWSAAIRTGRDAANVHPAAAAPATAVALDANQRTDQPPPPTNKVMSGGLITDLQDLTGVRIMWDTSHDQDPSYYHLNMISDLELRGAEVFENAAPITPVLLSTCDIVWTRECYEWSPSEISALVTWVGAGGGLLFEGDENISNFNEILSALGAGITYGGYANSGTTTSIYPHETTTGVYALYLGGPVTGLSAVLAPAGLLAEDNSGNAALAWSEVGSGRIVTFCDEILADYTLDAESNRLFGNQVFDWLAGASWLQVEPTSGMVPAGASQDVTVTFDATDLCGGEFAAQVAVTSNDPITPEVSVPTSLDVIGESDITVTPASLAYGPQYIGAVVPDTLTVTNDGCELLTVSSLTSDNLEFTVLPAGPFTLAPDASQVVVVTYAPATVGPVAGGADDRERRPRRAGDYGRAVGHGCAAAGDHGDAGFAVVDALSGRRRDADPDDRQHGSERPRLVGGNSTGRDATHVYPAGAARTGAGRGRR